MGPANRVYVFGAGFTRAFFPSAPLMEDNYDIGDLVQRYQHLPLAQTVLQTELDGAGPDRVNLERLMTRVSALMPYDSARRDAAELGVVLSDIQDLFETRLSLARQNPGPDFAVFQALARKCVEDGIATVTFNYDDTLDEALWKVKRQESVTSDHPYWHPDGGYAFFCQPADVTVSSGQMVTMDKVGRSPLFKLHGSVNWRIRRGARRPYALTDILHRAEWEPRSDTILDVMLNTEPDTEMESLIENHLEGQPFLVAPVLDKSEISQEPVLQTVWTAARARLLEAEEVVFVGYSFPPTDLAARFLFAESVGRGKRPAIRVVDYRKSEREREQLMDNYRAVFGRLAPEQFAWDGAIAWARLEAKELLAEEVSDAVAGR